MRESSVPAQTTGAGFGENCDRGRSLLSQLTVASCQLRVGRRMKRMSRLAFSSQLKLATDGASLPILLYQLGNECGPPGLVTSADAGAVVAVEVFMEWDQITPMGIFLEFFRAAEDRPAALFVA